MKINFKQPKYVIPLIILPFLIFGFFILGGKMNADKKAKPEEKTEGINTNMPGVDTGISKGEIKNKFSAYQQAFKNVTDQSAIGDMSKPGSGVQGFDYSSSYTLTDEQRLEAQRKMDSLNQVLKFGQSKIQNKIAQYNRSGGFDESRQTTERNSADDYYSDNETGDIRHNNLLKKRQEDSKPTFNDDNETPGSYESQMHVFHEQMRYLDSMQHVNEVPVKDGKNEAKHKTFNKDFIPKKDTSFKPLLIDLAIKAIQKKRDIFNINTKAYGMKMYVTNIYSIGDYIMIQLEAKNKTRLPFDIDQIRFKIIDKHQVKATISQDIELKPVYSLYETNSGIITRKFNNFYIFKKFTFPTQKLLEIEMTEKQYSGRHLSLKVEYNQILKSQQLD